MTSCSVTGCQRGRRLIQLGGEFENYRQNTLFKIRYSTRRGRASWPLPTDWADWSPSTYPSFISATYFSILSYNYHNSFFIPQAPTGKWQVLITIGLCSEPNTVPGKSRHWKDDDWMEGWKAGRQAGRLNGGKEEWIDGWMHACMKRWGILFFKYSKIKRPGS